MIINFISGVMGAGKSEKLIEDVKSFIQQGMKVVRVKISIERTKSNGEISSRSGKRISCHVLNVEQTEFEMMASLSKHIQNCNNVDYIFVDEAQFLSAEQINAIENAALISNANIVFYGLMTDFTGKLFDGAKHIMKICDDVEIIPATCEAANCFEFATQNARFVNGRVTTTGKQLVEDKQVYAALCSMCFKKLQ